MENSKLQNQLNHFLKNLSILGGMLVIVQADSARQGGARVPRGQPA